MELFIYYCIAALSFAIMYTLRYGSEVIIDVYTSLDILGVEPEIDPWSPLSYLLILFIVAVLGMPLLCYSMLTNDFYDVTEAATLRILSKYYGVILEDKEK